MDPVELLEEVSNYCVYHVCLLSATLKRQVENTMKLAGNVTVDVERIRNPYLETTDGRYEEV